MHHLSTLNREMWDFFRDLEIPHLSIEGREMLDAPIDLKELRQTVAALTSQESPGPDGLPGEIYKKYGEVLMPMLLKVLNKAMEEGWLPASMMESSIIVLRKEGKDPLTSSSFRPISLLVADVKILAGILASRLRRVISKCVHPDQSGFISGRATSIYIR